MRIPMETIAGQDDAFCWHFRVIGYSDQGTVVISECVSTDAGVEAAHDRIMGVPSVRSTYIVGPFRSVLA